MLLDLSETISWVLTEYSDFSLQSVVKEKDAHIEQLLQEIEMERAELAKVTMEREQVGNLLKSFLPTVKPLPPFVHILHFLCVQ